MVMSTERVQVDKFGNVMVYKDGKWVRDTGITNRIKLALKKGTVKDKVGTVDNGVKITQSLVDKVNQKIQIQDKGRGVTESLKQETSPKGKPLYKDKPVRTEPKAPPKNAAAIAKEGAATVKAAEDARKLKTPEYEITSVKKDGKTTITVNVNGKPDADLKKALWKVVQNPKNLKGKESVKVGNKTVPISIVRDFWKAMPKEVTKSIMTPKGGPRIGGPLLGGGGMFMKQIK
jgi:hypothetical protein